MSRRSQLIFILLTALAFVLLAPLGALAQAKQSDYHWPPALTKPYLNSCIAGGEASLKGRKLHVSKAVAQKAVVAYCRCTLAYLEARLTTKQMVTYSLRIAAGKKQDPRVQSTIRAAIGRCAAPFAKKMNP